MALVKVGTVNSSVLNAIQFGVDITAADIADIRNSILDDLIGIPRIFTGAFGDGGTLIVPNRGTLLLRDGDYVAVDPSTGWPILISQQAAAQSSTWQFG